MHLAELMSGAVLRTHVVRIMPVGNSIAVVVEGSKVIHGASVGPFPRSLRLCLIRAECDEQHRKGKQQYERHVFLHVILLLVPFLICMSLVLETHEFLATTYSTTVPIERGPVAVSQSAADSHLAVSLLKRKDHFGGITFDTFVEVIRHDCRDQRLVVRSDGFLARPGSVLVAFALHETLGATFHVVEEVIDNPPKGETSMKPTSQCIVLLVLMWLAHPVLPAQDKKAGDEALGTKKYADFEKPEFCGTSCHVDFYQQWKQAMMSQAYVHHWDEIEYFKLAVPHAEKDPKVAGVKAGCNGCHAPMAFLAGDVPPPRPEANSRANESVSCDVCHTITGFKGDVPHNFNYVSEPGNIKYGPRDGVVSPAHQTMKSTFIHTAEFCGTCHNEKDPYGIWVKSTHLEWKDGPYSKEGVRCQDCHMTRAYAQVSSMSESMPDVYQHLFHGAHDPGKVRGTIEVRIHPDTREIEPGESVKFTVALFNQKTGHKFPTGSAEERLVWLHVEATDAKGNVHHLPVDRKGFEGEGFTIAANTLAYQDMGIPLNIADFKGIQRDGVPVGDRIFRLPYLDPQGRMTIQQWNTASLGPDYRIGPRETKIETYTWTVPATLPPGQMTVKAVINYQKLPVPVAEFLGVPREEAEAIEVGAHSTSVNILQ